MTTPSTPRKAGPLLGTGAQTSWPFTFKVFAASDIAVTIANNLGVETALVLNADYSVTLNSNQDTSPGGTVTYPISGSALPTGSRLTIFGNLPYDQPLDLPSGGNFSPLALENQLDRLTMQIQQLREQLGRSLTVPVTSGVSPSLPSPAASNIIGWNENGDNLENYPLSELATSLAFATYRYDTFNGDGSTTQFTLSADPVTLGNLDVAVGGVTQTPGADYLLVAGVIEFTSAPPLGATILARFGEGVASGPSMDSYDVRFRQAGTGSVDRTAESKMREFVSVKDFGADPTGATDSRQAILDALNASGKIYFPPGNYVSSASIVVRNRNIEIEGNGASLTFTTGFLDIGGSIGTAFTLSANAVRGANVFTVSGGGFAPGDIMQLVDTTDFSYSLHRSSYRRGQLFTVLEASGNVLTTFEDALAAWTTGANISVKKITPVKVAIRNLNVFAPDHLSSSTGCRVIYAAHVLIENSSFKGGDQSALRISYSKGIVVNSCSCVCQAPTTTGTQYGISIDDSEDVLVDGCYLYGTRHATGLGGSGTTGSKFIVVQNSELANDQQVGLYSADIHGNVSFITYQNNTIYGGAAIAGEYAQYLNNTVFASNRAGTAFPAFNLVEIVGGNFVIDGNKIIMPGGSDHISVINATSSPLRGTINYSYHIQITNNEFTLNASQTNVIVLGTNYLRPLVQPSLTWENNKFRNDCSGLARIVNLASTRDPSTLVYVATTGPFSIKDFDQHVTMTSSINLIDVTAGVVANGSKFYLPELSFRQAVNLLSGTASRTEPITFPFNYGNAVTPPIQATMQNTEVQNGYWPFVGPANITSTGFDAVFTTGDNANTLSANKVYTGVFRVGGPVTK